MAVKSSGTLSFNTDIVGEFGGSAPHSLSEYKRGGLLVPEYASNTDIPTTNSNIQFSDFYGAEDVTTLTSAAQVNGQNNRKEITVSSFISSGEVLLIPSGMWVWSDNRTVAGLTIDIPCTILNYGKIIGRGGNGANPYYTNTAQSGGPAVKINSGVSNVTIINYSGAYIAGGGGGGTSYGGGDKGRYGGGGGGAGGGVGGPSSVGASGGAGGTLNAAGSRGSASLDNNEGHMYYVFGGYGGGSGGGRGDFDGDGSDNGAGGGGGGGRILPGVGGLNGAGGTHGKGGSAGASASNGGGGGWGAAGGGGYGNLSGGAGGKAIEDSGNTYTLTNNGTIYGATT